MFSPSPLVDTRSRDDVTSQVTSLVQAYTADPTQPGSGWAPPGGKPDLASALISVFALMAKYAIDRVNQFPDKAYLAFLDMVGVEPTPPQAAEVPLTFSLATGTPAGVLVPAGTLVGAEAVATDTGPVTFETEDDLVVSPAVLAQAFSYAPTNDEYTDQTSQATGASTGYYPVFSGTTTLEHSLYLAADTVLTMPAGTQITLNVNLGTGSTSSQWQALSLAWSYWSSTTSSWHALTLTSGTQSSTTIGFAIPSDMASTTVNGQAASWLRVTLTSWPSSGTIPSVASVTLQSASVTRSGILPDSATSSAGTIDLTADFYPFGTQPAFNSTWYLASATAFATLGATVAMTVTLSSQNPGISTTSPHSDSPIVIWEVWTGSVWLQVGRSTSSHTFDPPTGPNTYGFSDGTKAFTQGGTVSFTLPANVAPTTVAGVTNSWLRVRLLGADNYGLGITLTSGSGGTITVTNDGYRPPILASVALAYTVMPTVTASALAYNSLSFTSLSGAPFVRLSDVEPVLYLGFDRAFENRAVSIFVQIAPLSISDLTALGDPTTPPTVEWEYWGASGWSLLGVTDETRSFAESGLVTFVGPVDFTSTTVLGQTRFWLRVRLHAGQPAAPPRAGRIALNTIWASNTATTKTEVLGSSNGTPGQSFTLLHTPVLQGQRIYINEPALPPADEQAAIEALEGGDAILIVPGTGAQSDQIWVRWHEVTDFYGSGSRDRHYIVEHDTGVVSFGDGIHGMVPPQGQQNVWSFFYQSGGGAQGNRAAGTVNQLKSAIASIGGVTNYEEATGGADTESMDRVRALGPTALRNGGRAIAAQDYEDLALEASSEVARAKLVSPHFDPVAEETTPTEAPEAGKVTLLIVPFSNDVPPTPGLGLVRDLTTYLQARIAPAVSLRITGPVWIAVSVVDLTLVPISAEGADALRAHVVTAITAFLHPLTGGFDGTGWAFGQLPQPSDIYRLVMGIAGVDAVVGFTLETNPTPNLTNADVVDSILIYSGTHTVVITAPDAGA